MFSLNLRQKERQILHIDADAFFASVEQLENPKLANKPVLVGGPDSRRGIVAAASYEARKFGIRSAMPMYLAKKKCPQAIVVPGNFKIYREYSRRLRAIMQEFTPDVEMASVDEAYLDISGCFGIFEKGDPRRESAAKSFALKILWEIYRQIGLSVSCGLASSKMVAKIASSMNKPHKFTAVPYGCEREFLASLELRAMPGIGPNTMRHLENLGFKTLGDIAQLSLTEVLKVLGVRGVGLWKRCQGFDDNKVNGERSLPKSISKEHTFYDAVFANEKGLEECLILMKQLMKNVLVKLRRDEMKAGVIFIKIRYQDGDGKRHFEDLSVQKSLELPSSSDLYLFTIFKDLFLQKVERKRRIRLIGLGVGNLKQNYNLNLFREQERDDSLFEEIDKMSQKFGLERVYA